MTLHLCDVIYNNNNNKKSQQAKRNNLREIALRVKQLKPFFFAIHNCTEKQHNFIQKCLSSQHNDHVAQYLNRKEELTKNTSQLYYCRNAYYMPNNQIYNLFPKLIKHKTVIGTKQLAINPIETGEYVSFKNVPKKWYKQELSGYFNQFINYHCPWKYKRKASADYTSVLYNVQLTPGQMNTAIRKEQLKECIQDVLKYITAESSKKTHTKAVVLRGDWKFEQFSDEYHELFHYLKSQHLLGKDSNTYAFPPKRLVHHPISHFCFVITTYTDIRYKIHSPKTGEYGFIQVYSESQLKEPCKEIPKEIKKRASNTTRKKKSKLDKQ